MFHSCPILGPEGSCWYFPPAMQWKVIKERVIKGGRYSAWNINLSMLVYTEWVEKNPLTQKLSLVPPSVFSIWTCFDTAATGIYTRDETLTGGPRRWAVKLEPICFPVTGRKKLKKKRVKEKLLGYKVKASKTNSPKGWKGVYSIKQESASVFFQLCGTFWHWLCKSGRHQFSFLQCRMCLGGFDGQRKGRSVCKKQSQ